MADETKIPRCWELRGRDNEYFAFVAIAFGPALADTERANVVEAEPVADLLEHLRTAAMPYIHEAAPDEQVNGEWCRRFDDLCDAVHEAEALLRHLGRDVQ